MTHELTIIQYLRFFSSSIILCLWLSLSVPLFVAGSQFEFVFLSLTLSLSLLHSHSLTVLHSYSLTLFHSHSLSFSLSFTLTFYGIRRFAHSLDQKLSKSTPKLLKTRKSFHNRNQLIEPVIFMYQIRFLIFTPKKFFSVPFW